jgi:hypothetical protein
MSANDPERTWRAAQPAGLEALGNDAKGLHWRTRSFLADISWRRHEATELVLDKFGKENRRAVFEVRADDLDTDW